MTDRAKNPPKNGRMPDGRFAPGNKASPGRPLGSKHRTTIAVETLLAGEAEKLTRKAVEIALSGDVTALRICLDRISPVKRERTIEFALPPIKTASDIVVAANSIAGAVAAGLLTPGEAASLSALVGNVGKAIELHEHEQRIRALEEVNANRKS
jgi:hypothetical protein